MIPQTFAIFHIREYAFYIPKIGQTKAKEKLELTSHSQRVGNFTKLLLPNDYGNISKSMPDF